MFYGNSPITLLTTNPDWQIWTAALVTDTATRDLFIGGVRKYIASGVNNVPLSDWYETTNAVSQGFRARSEMRLSFPAFY